MFLGLIDLLLQGLLLLLQLGFGGTRLVDGFLNGAPELLVEVELDAIVAEPT